MIRLQSDGKVVEVSILEPTVKRFEEFKGYLDKLKEQIDSRGELDRVKAIAKVIKSHPDLLDMINYDGTFKQAAIKEKADVIVKHKEVSQEEAQQAVIQQFTQKIALIAAEDKEVANAIYFPDLDYPVNINSVQVAIEVIKATVNKSALSKEELRLIASEKFWHNVEWKGVAEYANTFRELYQ